MNKISKIIKASPIWLLTVLISIITVGFFVYLSFQINLFPEVSVRRLYYVDNISEAHIRIIKKFNEKYKDKIEVVPVNLPFANFTTNDRKEILTRSLRSRSDGIDIFAVDLIWIPRFAKWGLSFDNSFDKRTLQQVNNTALKACYHKDSLVAFPLFLDIGVMYYRKDIVEALPHGDEIEKKIRNSLTWREFISLGNQLKTSGHPYYIFSGGNFEGMICNFHEMLTSADGDNIFNIDNINLNKPSARRALQQLYDFVYTYKFSPYDVTRFDDFNSYIYAYEKDAVFLRGWIGYHKQYRDFLTDTSKISRLEIAPLPHFDGQNPSSVFGGWCLMVSKFSNRKDEAIKFINFMFEKENQEILYEDGGYLPINSEVYQDSVFIKKHRELTQIQKLLKWGKHRPSMENYTKISEIMSRYFHKALQNEISVNEALISATKQINSDRAVK